MIACSSQRQTTKLHTLSLHRASGMNDVIPSCVLFLLFLSHYDVISRRLLRKYQHLHARVHHAFRPLQMIYFSDKNEACLAWTTSGFELYATFSPLTPKPEAISGVVDLIKWMKREETSLFILQSQTF